MGVEPGVFTTRRGAQYAATAADDVDAAASTSTPKSLEDFWAGATQPVDLLDLVDQIRVQRLPSHVSYVEWKGRTWSDDPGIRRHIVVAGAIVQKTQRQRHDVVDTTTDDTHLSTLTETFENRFGHRAPPWRDYQPYVSRRTAADDSRLNCASVTAERFS